ncbi:MAG TPA: ABC transporter ATP-binding protein [Gemmatimonadales bacterium]|nr:ABC transporter ATP-binding protein [Gemmatimonadales bacterium]
MSEPRIVVDHLWKRFRRGERQDSLRDLVPALFRRLTPGRKEPELGANDFWAIRDVGFEVQEGEALGIIGPNGAGKSTMLKLLNRILRPTSGTIRLHGKVSALIEVAAGFHPDLTGRENIFLQGAIIGMRRAEIARKLDSIIDFAGVERFIDTPVKRYSTGMSARLGFAVAAHLDPDILLIDEVLSVGDMAFQEKCIARMKQFKASGVSIIFVSHNMQAVSDLCDHALSLRSTVQHYGSAQDVIQSYVTAMGSEGGTLGHPDVNIGPVVLRNAEGRDVTTATSGERLQLEVTYTARRDLTGVHFGLLLHRTTDGLLVYDANFTDKELGIRQWRSGEPVTIRFDLTATVTRGQYHFDTHVAETGTGVLLARRNPAMLLRVDELRTWAGIANLAVTASARTTERVASAVRV